MTINIFSFLLLECSMTTPQKLRGLYCSAVNCHNIQSRDSLKGVKFYRFPADPKRCQEWLLKVNRLNPDKSPWKLTAGNSHKIIIKYSNIL